MESTEAQIDEEIAYLLRAAQKRFRYERARLIGTAAYFAVKAHEGQKRKTGEPYVLHPIRIAKQLIEREDSRIDVSTICAALLHDVLEDTEVSADKIGAQFGRDVLSLVQSLTKKPSDKPRSEQDQEYFEQLRRYEKTDPRTGIIKVFDVYDNAQTIEVHSKERQEQRANNILTFYAPLAKRLEIEDIEEQLITIAKQYTDPVN